MTCNENCIHYPVCKEKDYDFAQIDECSFYMEQKSERPHAECRTCKHYVPYREQFSYGYRGDGYCKSTITTSEGQAYINCHDEWYCANYEKEGVEK